ncbi:MAG TPA: carboxylesterase/lipase family protein [Acetobacteraceae bacterium]|nr:carboxylesterase/lipase family protein [Acetobacteraceae bacterium]
MPTDPIVETTHGRVGGSTVEGVLAFKSVPYGAPTDGANRFRPPEPPAPWAGVREATEFRTQSPQSRLGFPVRPELAELWGPPDPSPESEDCLTLNVWTASLDPAARRPVMVWLHGGAFSFGSSNQVRLRGTRLVKRGDVVVVTVNQRLNIFGHLDLAPFAGAEFAQSGNAGALDMLAALRWVRDNIAAFGGDPGNVTIFGESGGGAKVCTLMAMPAARGLFHRAIVQSGAVVRLREPARAARLTEEVLRALDIPPKDARRLQHVPMRGLLAAIEPAVRAAGPSPWPLFDRYPFGPTVDGALIPAHPFHPAAPAPAASIPLLIGDTRDEMAGFLAHDDAVWNRTLSESAMQARVRAVAGDHTARVVALYRRPYPAASPAERLIATLTDSNFRIRSLIAAEHKAAQKTAPLWMYNFAWRSSAHAGRLGATHAIDVPFVFDTIDLTHAADGSEAARRLAALCSETWIAFARAARPAHAALPDWPAYDTQRRATMVLDETCRVEDDPMGETRALWREIARPD